MAASNCRQHLGPQTLGVVIRVAEQQVQELGELQELSRREQLGAGRAAVVGCKQARCGAVQERRGCHDPFHCPACCVSGMDERKVVVDVFTKEVHAAH